MSIAHSDAGVSGQVAGGDFPIGQVGRARGACCMLSWERI